MNVYKSWCSSKCITYVFAMNYDWDKIIKNYMNFCKDTKTGQQIVHIILIKFPLSLVMEKSVRYSQIT